jgi:hypothetical protein
MRRLGIPPEFSLTFRAWAPSAVLVGGLDLRKLSSMSQNHLSSLTLGFVMLSMICGIR